jgi:hypothetical protein
MLDLCRPAIMPGAYHHWPPLNDSEPCGDLPSLLPYCLRCWNINRVQPGSAADATTLADMANFELAYAGPDHQTKLVAGVSSLCSLTPLNPDPEDKVALLAAAKYNLKHNFAWFAILERLDESLTLLHGHSQSGDERIAAKIVQPKAKAHIPGKSYVPREWTQNLPACEKAKISHTVDLDVELYEFGLALMDQRLAALGLQPTQSRERAQQMKRAHLNLQRCLPEDHPWKSLLYASLSSRVDCAEISLGHLLMPGRERGTIQSLTDCAALAKAVQKANILGQALPPTSVAAELAKQVAQATDRKRTKLEQDAWTLKVEEEGGAESCRDAWEAVRERSGTSGSCAEFQLAGHCTSGDFAEGMAQHCQKTCGLCGLDTCERCPKGQCDRAGDKHDGPCVKFKKATGGEAFHCKVGPLKPRKLGGGPPCPSPSGCWTYEGIRFYSLHAPAPCQGQGSEVVSLLPQ